MNGRAAVLGRCTALMARRWRAEGNRAVLSSFSAIKLLSFEASANSLWNAAPPGAESPGVMIALCENR